jgi:hypothetical protein
MIRPNVLHEFVAEDLTRILQTRPKRESRPGVLKYTIAACVFSVAKERQQRSNNSSSSGAHAGPKLGST